MHNFHNMVMMQNICTASKHTKHWYLSLYNSDTQIMSFTIHASHVNNQNKMTIIMNPESHRWITTNNTYPWFSIAVLLLCTFLTPCSLVIAFLSPPPLTLTPLLLLASLNMDKIFISLVVKLPRGVVMLTWSFSQSSGRQFGLTLSMNISVGCVSRETINSENVY